MPNEYANKVQVVRGGQTETLIDLTADTVTPSALAEGYTAHDKSGALITGTATGGSMVIRDEQDSHGGTIRSITAGSVVQGTKAITANGTYDVAEFADASVDVDVQASGGSSYTLVYSTTLEVSTTSTTAVEVATIETGDTSIWTSDKLVYVKIRDAAGWRNGYFYGMDAFLANNSPTIGGTESYAWFGRGYSMASNKRYPMPMLALSTSTAAAPQGYGVYPTFLYNDGSIQIKARYSSSSTTNTRTIDGTFSVDVYLLDWPSGVSPFA